MIISKRADSLETYYSEIEIDLDDAIFDIKQDGSYTIVNDDYEWGLNASHNRGDKWIDPESGLVICSDDEMFDFCLDLLEPHIPAAKGVYNVGATFVIGLKIKDVQVNRNEYTDNYSKAKIELSIDDSSVHDVGVDLIEE
jgi:hypothetical protein